MLTLFCKQIDDARLKSGCVTFNDVLDVWLAETRGRVKRSTLATYGGACERYIRPALGPVPTEQMTDEEVAKVPGRGIGNLFLLHAADNLPHPALSPRACARRGAVRGGQRALSTPARRAARGADTQSGGPAPPARDPPARGRARPARDTAVHVHGHAPGRGLRPALGRLLARYIYKENAPAPRRPRRGAQDRARARHAQELQLHARDTAPRPAAPGARERARGDDCYVLTGTDTPMEPRRFQSRFKAALRDAGVPTSTSTPCGTLLPQIV